MSAPIRVLVVDDDPLSRERIRELLATEADVEVVGECPDGGRAVAAIREQAPDLVFLDVQMPGMSGLEVVAEVGAERMPLVVFVSAYADFAVRAFDACALDYLLKPFPDDRFQAALARARDQLRLRQRGQDPRLDALLELVRRPQQQEYPEALAVRSGEQYTLVRVQEIDWIEAEGNYARLHVGASTRLISQTLTQLETRILDPKRFLRIHRSTIVNLERIVALEPLFHGEYSVRLRDGTRLVCSRRHRQKLQERIYFTS